MAHFERWQKMSATSIYSSLSLAQRMWETFKLISCQWQCQTLCWLSLSLFINRLERCVSAFFFLSITTSIEDSSSHQCFEVCILPSQLWHVFSCFYFSFNCIVSLLSCLQVVLNLFLFFPLHQCKFLIKIALPIKTTTANIGICSLMAMCFGSK